MKSLPASSWAAAALAAAVLILDPLREFPLQDDWAYFISVEHLLREGRLMVPDYTSATLVFQTIWGGLFAMVFGLSHSALRLSTLALGLLSIFLMEFFSRDGSEKSHPALAPPFLLLANPLFFLLSFTFLTDVPHLAWTLAALACAWRAEKTDRPAWWLAASAAASLAYLVRQIGILAPAGIILHLRVQGKLTRRRAFLLAAIPLAVLGAHQYWFHFIHGSTLTFEVYRRATAAGFSEPLKLAWSLYTRVGVAVLYCGLFSLPHLLALGAGGVKLPSRSVGLSAAALLAPVFLGADSLFNMGVIYRAGLGSPDISGPGAKVAGVLGASWFHFLLAGAAVAAVLGWLGRRSELKAAWKSEGVSLIAFPCLLQFAAMLPGAIYTDRYMLPLVPLAALWGFQAWRSSSGARRPAPAGVLAAAALFAWSCLGTWDYLNWNEAKWAAGRAAAGLGIGPGRLFNGLDWCGSHTYEANMKRLRAVKPAGQIGYWEWLTSQRFDYATSFAAAPVAGEVLSVSYRTPLSRTSGRISVRRLKPGESLP